MQWSNARSRLSEMPRQYPICWRSWSTSKLDFRSSNLHVDRERVTLAGLNFIALQDIRSRLPVTACIVAIEYVKSVAPVTPQQRFDPNRTSTHNSVFIYI